MVHVKTQVPDSFATHTAWRVDNVTNIAHQSFCPNFIGTAQDLRFIVENVRLNFRKMGIYD